MRKFVVTLMASLLSCSAAFAFWPEATDSSLEIGVGYRRDRLEWKTSSDLASSYGGYDYGFPRLSSKLKWRDLNIWQIEALGKYVTCDNIYLRFNADYGWITNGKNKDSDDISFDGYGEDFQFAHSKSKAKGNVYDARIAVGYQFKMCDDSFAVAPVVGYSWHGQRIKDHHLKHHEYSIDDLDVNFGNDYGYDYYYGGKHSHYHTRWNGPFVGFDFDYRFGCGCEADWQLFGSYEYHWANFHARGKWHLRTDLLDGFHHRSKDAHGQIFDIGVKWDFCENWTVALKGEFQWWFAKHGHDRAKIAEASLGDAETNCVLKIPLHHVKWDSYAVSIDVGMAF